MTKPSIRGTSMNVPTVIRITPEGKECIRKAANGQGLSASNFVRRVLANAGVF